MPLASVYPLVSARAVARPFTYEVPEGTERGAVVAVRFGRAKRRGIVTEVGVEAPPGCRRGARSRTWSTRSRPRSSSSRSGWPGYYGSTPARALELVAPRSPEAAQGAAVRGRGARAAGRGRAGRRSPARSARRSTASSPRSTARAARSCCTARRAAARPRSTCRRARPRSSAGARRSCSCPRSRSRRRRSAASEPASATASRSCTRA